MPGGQGRGCLSQAPGGGEERGGGGRVGEGGRERWGAWSSGVRELSRAPNTIDSSNSNNWGSKVQEFGSEAARVSTLSPGGCVGAWAPGRRDVLATRGDSGPGLRPLQRGGRGGSPRELRGAGGSPRRCPAAACAALAGGRLPLGAAAAAALGSSVRGEGREGSWTRRRFMGLSGEQVPLRAAHCLAGLTMGLLQPQCRPPPRPAACTGARAPGRRGPSVRRALVVSASVRASSALQAAGSRPGAPGVCPGA